MHASQKAHTETYAHPLVPEIWDEESTLLDQISNLILKSYLKSLEHEDDEPDQRPKWAQSIILKFNYLMDNHDDPRRMRSQLDGDPHAPTTIEYVMPMHFYMVMASDPPTYAEDEGNPYWNTSMDEGDLDLLISNKRKWIYVDISLMHLLHHIHTNIYIFKKIFTEHKLPHLWGLLGLKDTFA